MVQFRTSTLVLFASLSCVLAAAVGPASAKTFRWASASDIPTWDIHSQNNALRQRRACLGLRVAGLLQQPQLQARADAGHRLEAGQPDAGAHHPAPGREVPRRRAPSLPTTRCSRSSARWRRRRTTASTRRASTASSRSTPTPIDIFTKGPNPVLLQPADRAAHDGARPGPRRTTRVEPKDIQDARTRTSPTATPMGTGPFMLKSGSRTSSWCWRRNPNWWGKLEGNVTEIIYTPIKSEATRVAALLSGEVDLVLDPSPQDLPRLRQQPEPEGDRRRREPHHLLRHGPVPRRAARLQRQGQEPAEGRARAQGAVPGDRHRRRSRGDDARPGASPPAR